MDPKRPSAVSARDDREDVGDINLIIGELSGPRKCTPRTSDDRGGEEGLEEEGGGRGGRRDRGTGGVVRRGIFSDRTATDGGGGVSGTRVS